MKKFFLPLFLLFVGLTIAQQKASRFTDGNDDNAPRNPRMDMMNFVPNEVLLKFKDEVTVPNGSRVKAAGVNAVDQVLQNYGVTSLEKLFPEVQKPQRMRVMKTPQGNELKIPRIDNIYRVVIPQDEQNKLPVNILQVIDELKALAEIEYAEPNYIYSIDQLQPVGPELTAKEVEKLQSKRQKTNGSAVVPNDPLYPQQWHIPAVKADLVWEQTTGDTTQVIAILDTGVDWTHPDLKNKMWRNWGEIPDNGIDDDGNGLVDDYMGWDYINNDNNPMDDNSHGTHVAGIAAAETNNGIGIAGVNWYAKIMPIKVFQSSGRGDAATITKGIIYAAQKGATVINMSFGSYARSFSIEYALLNIYPDCFFAAAAGNDGKSIYDIDSFGYNFINYPAAFQFVFGVQSPDEFSNYDPDGPVLSTISDNLNYELKAPGYNILSTTPNGNYRFFSGTSMATPIVSASLALHRSNFPEKTLEELWSDFIHSNNDGIIDVYNVLYGISNTPKLHLENFKINDQNIDCDKDDKADAGETVNLIIKVRNTGQPALNVYAKIKPAEDGNQNDISIINDSINFGSIGIYRSQINDTIPFKIKLSKTCMNNSFASVDVYMYNNVDTTVSIQNIKFKMYNGQELSGILTKDTTLSAENNWVITNSLRIASGVTVTIAPGASVEVLSGVDNRGKVIAIGTPEKRINFTGSIGGYGEFKYANIDLKGADFSATYLDHCEISNTGNFSATKITNSKISLNYDFTNNQFWCDTARNCYINNVRLYNPEGRTLNINECIIENCNFVNSSPFNGEIKNSVFTKIKNWLLLTNPGYYYKIDYKVFVILYYSDIEIFWGKTYNIKNNSFLENEEGAYFLRTWGGSDYVTLANQYWGTTNEKKIRKKYYDFNQDAGLPYFNFEPKLNIPSDSCHAHVWKILVNGKDAQDEIVDPVGVGKQRFDVYFNRPMNKAITPKVTFGGMYPYVSIPINEDGAWSEDGKIYTVYKTIKLTTGDGINRIRVAGAKKDAEWAWEIPVEDSRFEFIIAAASSASLEFMATPGLGKVALEWNNNDLEDGLGYNMYRMEHINDSTLTQPVLINNSLITDTLYTDFSVIPNKRYYYYYKILRTNMAETDSSQVVSAVPFTASKGDANGDLSVNVLDITTIVAHLLNNNPQPFIQEAADVNNDSQINVLDIVGVVNLVLNIPQQSAGIAMTKQVNLYLQNDTLFADSNVDIGALQLDLTGMEKFEDLVVLDALKGFESGNSYANGVLRVIFYSMSGKSIPAGQGIPLLKLKFGTSIADAIVGEPNGSSVKVNYLRTRIPDIRNNMNQQIAELGQNYPNPANGITTIPVRIYDQVDEITLRIVNMMGQEVQVIRIAHPYIGEHKLPWNSGTNKGMFVYTLELRNGNRKLMCPNRKMVVQ